MMESEQNRHFETREKWRKWLGKNHQKSDGIWVVFYKKHTGRKTVSYNEAVEEALCFGWIDSILTRIDDEKYRQKFSPRKKRSNWSLPNIERAKKMLAAGKMTPSGMKQFKNILSGKEAHRIANKSPKVVPMPDYFRKVLDSNAKAKEFFASLAPSYKRQFLLWITTAKTTKTREKRIAESMEYLKAGKKLGMK